MRRLWWLGVVAAGVLLVGGSASAHRSATHAKTHFVNYGLAETPGVSCPGSKKCSNIASEPQIRADATGTFYASSENGLGGGTEAWRSSDGGRHYLALVSPNQRSSADDTG